MSRPRPILLAATLFGIAAGILLGLRPWRAWVEERADVRGRESELRRLRKERVDLEHEAAAARSSVGREERARQSDYRAPGEKDLRTP